MNVSGTRRAPLRTGVLDMAAVKPRVDADDTKRLYEQNPELYRVFRRLGEIPTPPSHCRPLHPMHLPGGAGRVSIPHAGGLQCMCYEGLLGIIRQHAPLRPPHVFRLARDKNYVRVETSSLMPTWSKHAMMGFYGNETLQYPMATVIVRWQLKRKLRNYDLPRVRKLLAQYGAVESLKALAPNICVVTFRDLASACAVIEASHIGDAGNKLHCTWWHKSMANKSVLQRARGLAVKVDPFL